LLSPSAFHRQFKAVTPMTPIQYQKQLRLLEAWRMILTQRTKAESAAYATGYESSSQFSREYARMFGRSPKQDANIGVVELEQWHRQFWGLPFQPRILSLDGGTSSSESSS